MPETPAPPAPPPPAKQPSNPASVSAEPNPVPGPIFYKIDTDPKHSEWLKVRHDDPPNRYVRTFTVHFRPFNAPSAGQSVGIIFATRQPQGKPINEHVAIPIVKTGASYIDFGKPTLVREVQAGTGRFTPILDSNSQPKHLSGDSLEFFKQALLAYLVKGGYCDEQVARKDAGYEPGHNAAQMVMRGEMPAPDAISGPRR
jgi:hypothetical protein